MIERDYQFIYELKNELNNNTIEIPYSSRVKKLKRLDSY